MQALKEGEGSILTLFVGKRNLHRPRLSAAASGKEDIPEDSEDPPPKTASLPEVAPVLPRPGHRVCGEIFGVGWVTRQRPGSSQEIGEELHYTILEPSRVQVRLGLDPLAFCHVPLHQAHRLLWKTMREEGKGFQGPVRAPGGRLIICPPPGLYVG